MSGLAVVAARSAPRSAARTAADGSPRSTALRAAGSTRASATTPPTCPPGTTSRSCVSTAIPDDNPERAAGRGAGLRVLPRAELLAELTRRKRHDRRGRHARQDDDDARCSPTRCSRGGLDPAYLIGGELRDDGHATPPGATGEWLVVEADESDRSLLRLDAGDRGRDERRARPPRDLGSLRGPRRRLPRVPGGRRHAVVWDRPELRRAAGRRRRGRFDVAGRRPAPRRRALRAGAGTEVAPGRPGRPQRAERRRGARGRARSPAPTTRPRPPRSRASAARAGASRRWGARAAGALVVDDYAHHPTEVAATIAAARTLGAAARRRRLPAPPLLAHAPRSRASSARALATRRHRRGARRLPGARARRGLPGRERADARRGGRRRRRRAPGAVAAGVRRRRAGAARPARATATSCS